MAAAPWARTIGCSLVALARDRSRRHRLSKRGGTRTPRRRSARAANARAGQSTQASLTKTRKPVRRLSAWPPPTRAKAGAPPDARPRRSAPFFFEEVAQPNMVARERGDDGTRVQQVFSRRAIKRQRDKLEEKQRTLLKALTEVNSSLEMVHDMKRRTRAGAKLARFDPDENQVFAIAMDRETVLSRLMTPEAKRAIARNMRRV